MPQRLLLHPMKSRDLQVTAVAVHGASGVRAPFAPRPCHLPGIFQPGGILGVSTVPQPILADRMASRRLHLVGTPCPSFPRRSPNTSAPVVQVRCDPAGLGRPRSREHHWLVQPVRALPDTLPRGGLPVPARRPFGRTASRWLGRNVLEFKGFSSTSSPCARPAVTPDGSRSPRLVARAKGRTTALRSVFAPSRA